MKYMRQSTKEGSDIIKNARMRCIFLFKKKNSEKPTQFSGLYTENGAYQT